MADADLPKRRGGGHPDPEMRGRGEARSQKCVFVFLVLPASVRSKNKLRAPPLDPLQCFSFPFRVRVSGVLLTVLPITRPYWEWNLT